MVPQTLFSTDRVAGQRSRKFHDFRDFSTSISRRLWGLGWRATPESNVLVHVLGVSLRPNARSKNIFRSKKKSEVDKICFRKFCKVDIFGVVQILDWSIKLGPKNLRAGICSRKIFCRPRIFLLRKIFSQQKFVSVTHPIPVR